MTTMLHDAAPAKINLCLFVGPTRHDGRHELVSVMDTLTLADDVRLQVGPPGLQDDEVDCPGVEGPNLAAVALAAFRAQTAWDGPPVRVTIAKRIPVAGGMAGGSADAAAVLRLFARAAGLADDDRLERIAAGLGADVPSRIRGGCTLAEGMGELLQPLPAREPYSVLVLRLDHTLGAGAVYAEADRLGLGRDQAGLARARADVVAAIERGDGLGVVHNDLQDAARSLCPAITGALDEARAAGADHAIVSGSGPTVIGLFCGAGHDERAAEGAARLRAAGRDPEPVLVVPG